MIYIHIPFCKKACHYCDFHFSTSLKLKDKLINCILEEIKLRKNYLKNTFVETIYFGGGTPSLLNEKDLNLIFESIYQNFKIIENPEITLEANPDDLTTKKLKILNRSPINRLSIGVQSFHDDELKTMNRSHDAKQAKRCILEAQSIGFQNLSIDLIYGIPNSDLKKWTHNLSQTMAFKIPHLSAYCLTVEKNTALEKMISKGKIQALSEKKSIEQFNFLMDFLDKENYEHYEISNFSKAGFQSKHNSNYWKGKAYLGIGPSAHSFDGKTIRQWNVSNNSKYIQAIEKGKVLAEKEILSQKDLFNEFVLTQLRTSKGIDLEELRNKFSEKIFLNFQKEIKKINPEWLIQNPRKIQLSQKGKLFADFIASELFLV